MKVRWIVERYRMSMRIYLKNQRPIAMHEAVLQLSQVPVILVFVAFKSNELLSGWKCDLDTPRNPKPSFVSVICDSGDRSHDASPTLAVT